MSEWASVCGNYQQFKSFDGTGSAMPDTPPRLDREKLASGPFDQDDGNMDYVAWLKFGVGGRIIVCGSNDHGAFKVYRYREVKKAVEEARKSYAVSGPWTKPELEIARLSGELKSLKFRQLEEIEKAVDAERERCANIAESEEGEGYYSDAGPNIATKIRAKPEGEKG